jgi:HPr kinase/phosphorylase
MKRLIVHGTVVAFRGEGILLRGPSGSGKSDLAFRLSALGCGIVADDQAEIDQRSGRPFARAVEPITGLLELRGLGLIRIAPADPVPLRLVVDLVPRLEVPRMPEPETVKVGGAELPLVRLHAFDSSTPLKVLKALELVGRPDLLI